MSLDWIFPKKVPTFLEIFQKFFRKRPAPHTKITSRVVKDWYFSFSGNRDIIPFEKSFYRQMPFRIQEIEELFLILDSLFRGNDGVGC